MTVIDKILERVQSLDVAAIECAEPVKRVLLQLLNAVEALAQQIRKLREEIAYLKRLLHRDDKEEEKEEEEDDENQGNDDSPSTSPNQEKKPIPPNRRPPLERPSSPSQSRKPRSELTVTRTEPRSVDRALLPPDAVHKGYRNLIIQELIFQPDNICFRLERFYSPSTGKLYEAELPPGFPGCAHGPVLRSYILHQYFRNRVTERKLLQDLQEHGFQISAGQISRILTETIELFHQEKQDIFAAGVASTTYQHCDHTSAWVNGEKPYHTVVCNDSYSAFFTHPTKERLAVVGVFTGNLRLDYLIDANTIDYLKSTSIPDKYLEALQEQLSTQLLTAEQLNAFLDQRFPQLPQRYRHLLFEAAAVAFYQHLDPARQIPLLISDDAKEFDRLAAHHGLCWVHTARRFDALHPVLTVHEQILQRFYDQLWQFYQALKQYKENPQPQRQAALREEFDRIFTSHTGYEELDKKLALTAANKEKLLLVLEHPEIPLHNNPAELALRELVIKRKISVGTRSPKGARAWETFMTLYDTCRKQKIGFFDYLKDRLTKACQLPSLAELISRQHPPVRAPT
jgi:hypothetical protein